MDTPHECTCNADDGHGTGRSDHVEANAELDKHFASVMQSRPRVVVREVLGDEITETGDYHARTR